MKKHLMILFICILIAVIAACAPITEKNATDGAGEGAEDGAAASDGAPQFAKIGIDVTLDADAETASVHYFLDDADETFELTGTDKDLIIWEIAKKYNISLNRVRRTVAFDGERYSSELWEDTEGDVVPTESGEYQSDSGDGAAATGQADGDLWFDAYINDANDYTTVYAYRGDTLLEQFQIDWADKDVVIVDVKNKYGLTMNEAKAAMKFDGEWYVSRSNLALQKLDTSPESAEMRALAENLTYLAEKDEGFLRGVACDLENSLVKIRLTNIGSDTRLLFAERKPQIPESLRFVLNGKTLYNLDCGRATTENNSIEPEEFQECIKSGVYFIKSRPDFYTDKKDRIYITSIGVSEYLEFECK